MVESAAQSPAANNPRSKHWIWIERLFGITGVLGLALIVAVVISELPLQGSEILVASILAIPFVVSLLAFWQFRNVKQLHRWWLGIIGGFLGLIAAFLTGGYAPIIQPLGFLIRSSFNIYYVLLFLTNLTYVVLAVAGVWTLVAHFQDEKPRTDQAPVNQLPGAFYDSDGNQVVPAYAVQTSPTAVIAFVLVWFLSPIGLILGYIALNEIRRSQGARTGEGLAQATIIIGWVWIAVAMAFVIAFIVLQGRG